MDALMSPVLELSASQLARNVAAVRERITPSALMLAMKDDAYGHGIDWTLNALADDVELERFGSFDVDTGLRIRALRPRARVFAWTTSDDDEIRAAVDARLELGIGSAEYLRRVVAIARASGRSVAVHLKIDTGLHRNGIRPENWSEFVAEAASAQRAGAVRVVGAWSHLAEASDAEDDESAAGFRAAVDELHRQGIAPEDTHLTASAASWWRPELRGTVCRIGAFCYGIRSADGPQIPGVRPIAALRARVLDVGDRSVEVGIGALHGLPSTLVGASIGTPAGARQILAVGDMRSSVARWNGVSVGDVVSVFGPGDQGESDATALGEHIGTVGEEILTRLTPAVRRVAIR